MGQAVSFKNRMGHKHTQVSKEDYEKAPQGGQEKKDQSKNQEKETLMRLITPA